MADSLAFAEDQLKKEIVRDDYKEFLELIILFLGGNLKKGNRFRALGPIHHARWMAKAIYSLKMFLFRDQFHLTSSEESGLRELCIFIVVLYQKAWFTASNPITAPNNDWQLLKKIAQNIDTVGSVSSKICKAVFHKFEKHLWYLSEELIAFAFFDKNVSIEIKRKMCQALKTHSAFNSERNPRAIEIKDQRAVQELDLDSFVNEKTINFFKILTIDSSFLDSDPTTWETREDFIKAFEIVKSLHVTNDIAERSVALVSEYNNLLTKDEDSKQRALLIVQKFREMSPNYTKDALKFSLQTYLNNIELKP
ncbi:uncharacterized protein LOC107044808 [Diachasma alloeum]|uniref:uncharacterized protein LOC107044808 n=1 Tax=Diachasma alloeum TaxID=454923 RepID=UPI0007380FA1|nr:uncharacterized protein LOC107044808 [Diachasma alloeum]